MAVATTSQAQAPPALADPPLVKDSGPKVDTSRVPPAAQTSAKPAPRVAYLTLAVGRLQSSRTNPRKCFEGRDFDDLVASVREHGVIQPLLVRPMATPVGASSLLTPDKYEIVAGERRFRAAQKAGLWELPVVVRELSDAEALELQIVENLQRADVTELEEAEGYVQLLSSMARAAGAQTPRQKLVEQIAVKVAKSVRYVYGRMKLTELAPEVKTAIADGKITPSHGDEIARLPQSQQKKALEHCFGWNKETLSVRDFKGQLGRGFTAQLSAAPWKLDEVLPLPPKSKARLVACTACPANVDKTCYDTGCFAGKREAFVQVQIDKAYSVAVAEHDPKSPLNPSVVKLSTDWGSHAKDVSGAGAWVEAKKGSCKLYKIGVIAEGDGIGEMRRACMAASCKVHHPAASRRSSASAESTGDRERRLREAGKRTAGGSAVFEAILSKITALSGPALDLLLEQELEIGDPDNQALIAKQFGWTLADDSKFGALEALYRKHAKALTAEQKVKFFFAVRISQDVEWGQKRLDELATRLKLDPKKLRAAAAKQLEAEAKKPAAKAPAAKKKAGRK
jgi:ParB family chromosome partitioning protein